MTNHTVFKVYDSNGKYVGYYLYNEEALAARRASELGGRYEKVVRTFG